MGRQKLIMSYDVACMHVCMYIGVLGCCAWIKGNSTQNDGIQRSNTCTHTGKCAFIQPVYMHGLTNE